MFNRVFNRVMAVVLLVFIVASVVNIGAPVFAVDQNVFVQVEDFKFERPQRRYCAEDFTGSKLHHTVVIDEMRQSISSGGLGADKWVLDEGGRMVIYAFIYVKDCHQWLLGVFRRGENSQYVRLVTNFFLPRGQTPRAYIQRVRRSKKLHFVRRYGPKVKIFYRQSRFRKILRVTARAFDAMGMNVTVQPCKSANALYNKTGDVSLLDLKCSYRLKLTGSPRIVKLRKWRVLNHK